MARAKLESSVGDYIERSIEITKQVLKEAKLTPRDINEVILVGGQTRMPAMQEAVKKLFGKESHKGINPDEVVAIGAAVQAGIMQGDVRDVLLLDVTPLSLGIETLGGVMTVIIAKNTTIPTAKSQIFSTAADNQTSVEIHVLQGERPMALDNKTLGRFILDGIPPAPRGVPQIEVTFDIDANGILAVKAVDKATKKEQSIRIEASSALSKEEVERLRKESEVHATEDRIKKEKIEVQNMADSLIYVAEKSLRDYGNKLNASLRSEIESKIELLKKAKEADDVDSIKRATQDLSLALQKIGSEVYKGGQADDRTDNKKDDDSEEGRFEEKK